MSDFEEVVAETATHRVVLVPDDYPSEHMNPRSDAVNLGVMWLRRRGYTLGDETAGVEEFDELSNFIDTASQFGGSLADLNRAVVKHLMRKHGATVVMPLYIYEHSGMTVSAGEDMVGSGNFRFDKNHFGFDPGGWDTSFSGFIFDTERTRQECGTPTRLIKKGLQAEVEAYASWLEGDVWGYRVERKVHTVTRRTVRFGDETASSETEGDEWDVLDSCWGYLGHANAKEEALMEFRHYEKGRMIDLSRLGSFVAVASDDSVNDLELVCQACDSVLCDIEAGDSLQVLLFVASEHLCFECDWFVNDATEPAWCCNTHMYDGTGDFPATGDHPQECLPALLMADEHDLQELRRALGAQPVRPGEEVSLHIVLATYRKEKPDAAVVEVERAVIALSGGVVPDGDAPLFREVSAQYPGVLIP